MKYLLPYYRKLNNLIFPILLLFGTSIFYVVLSFAHPWIYKIVFENLIPTYDKDLLVQIIMCLFSIGILNIFSNVLIETLTTYIRTETINLIRIEVTGNLLAYQYSYFQKNQPGEIIQRLIPEVDGIGTMVAESVKVASYFIQIVLLLFMILIINFTMFIISAVVLFFYSVWFRFYRKPIAAFDERLKKHNGELYDIFAELFENVKNIKLFNLHRVKIDVVKNKLNLIERDTIKNSIIQSAFGFGGTIFPVAILIITGFCFHEILKEKMSIGYYLVFTALLVTLAWPIEVLLGFGRHLQTGIVSAKRIQAILTNDIEKSGSRKFDSFTSEIRMETVSFSYGDTKVLKNMSITVKKGQNVAIVGGSGSGKTTIAHLLVRLYEPAQGRISIDGIPLSSFDLVSLRNKIGLLSQDVFIFNGTVGENINPNGVLAAKEVEATLFKAQIPGFASKLDYCVGERGQKLSGGERQRLSVARLLGRKCEIIILDEATSNIDPRTTQELLKTFSDIQKENPQITFITITHNLVNLYAMDKIYFLENGSIAAQGSCTDLIKGNQSFRELFNVHA